MNSFCDVPTCMGLVLGWRVGVGGPTVGDEAVGVTADGHGGRLSVQDLDLGC